MIGKISVLILSQNSGKLIKRTLDSVKSFDEIIVIDGGSTDDTQEIVNSYPNAKFISNPWPGFNKQRNFSLTQASHDWCFMIDSDEACTAELAKELYRITSLPHAKKLYRVMRTEYFCGQPIETGYASSLYQERLYKKKHISYGGGVHHTHNIDGIHAGPEHPETEKINPNLRILHNPNYCLDDIYPRIARYSIEIAKEKVKNGRIVNIPEILLTLFGSVFQIYWKNWREGKRGLVLAVVEAIHRTLVKLYIYQENQFKK